MSITTPSTLPEITAGQLEEWETSVSQGLLALHRPEPLTAVEWADKHFYLSSESSYHEGRWVTLPFQVAILNSMGNDEIRTVNVVKSARLGYTKMLLAATGYLLEHKKRNALVFSPTDSDAESFMKSHLETMIRDVPPVLSLAPWYGMKHRDNTLAAKRFANGKQVFVHGGKAARNYREKSVDCVIYDELSAFDADIEQEGSPTTLGDKRVEGSTFQKSIRGSTPKITGACQIETAAEESPTKLRFHVPCPHCGEEQVLKWGGPEADFGIKWDKDKPETVFYLCAHNGCVIRQHEIQTDDSEVGTGAGRWICDETGIQTWDGIDWFDADGELVPTPESVTFFLWTVLSPFTTWERIVRDFLKAKGNRGKLKTFVNTTLGESWEEDEGSAPAWETLHIRREHYPAPVPEGVVALVAGADTQDDRLEAEIVGYGADEESWGIDYIRLYGDPGRPQLWHQLQDRLRRTFRRVDGVDMDVRLVCIDSGGHYTDEVYAWCARVGRGWAIPVRGASSFGAPLVKFPRKPNRRGVYLTNVGTDTAKELLYGRFALTDPGPGYCHWPVSEQFDESYFQQLTAERKQRKYRHGVPYFQWDAGGRRNEALDCRVYAQTAIRILQAHMGLNLAGEAEPMKQAKPKDTSKPANAKRRKRSSFW